MAEREFDKLSELDEFLNAVGIETPDNETKNRNVKQNRREEQGTRKNQGTNKRNKPRRRGKKESQDVEEKVFSHIPPMHLNKNNSSLNKASTNQDNGDSTLPLHPMYLNNQRQTSQKDPTQFITEVKKFESILNKNKNIQFTNTDLICKKLSNLQTYVGFYIQNLTTKNTEFLNFKEPESIESDSDNISNASSPALSIQKYLYESRLNCQFCCEVFPDWSELSLHVRQTCPAIVSKVYMNPKNSDYSFFQLLPSNRIKCNVCVDVTMNYYKDMIQHSDSRQHKGNIRKRNLQSRKKNKSAQITEYIFCSACKVLIPDNLTQFNQHLINPEHLKCKEMKPKPSRRILQQKLLGRGIYLFLDFDNCFCFLCKTNFDISSLFDHCNAVTHAQRSRKNGDEIKLYCRCCEEDVVQRDLNDHLYGNVHSLNSLDDQNVAMKFVYCTFCETQYENIDDLAKHQKYDCHKVWGNEETPKKVNSVSTPAFVGTHNFIDKEFDFEVLSLI